MLVSFLIIGGVLAATVLFLIRYHQRYVQRINEALVNDRVKRMPETRLMLFFLLLALTLATALYNLVPVLKEPDLDLSEIVVSDAVAHTSVTYDLSYFELSDRKSVDGGTVVAASNGNMICYGTMDATCQSHHNSASFIGFYDQTGAEVWHLGGLTADLENIRFEDILFDARAVDRLADGRFVAFGQMVDLTNSRFSLGLLVIDSDGSIADVVALDTAEYGITRFGGHTFYELVATEDGGFVLQYKELFDGSFVAKFDPELENEWSQMVAQPLESGVYSGIYVGHYAQTLLAADGWVYVLNNDEVRALDPMGTPRWSYTSYGHNYSGFRLQGGKLLLVGTQNHSVLQADNLFSLKETRNAMSRLNVEVLDPTTGSLSNRATFLYDSFTWQFGNAELSPRDLHVDEDGTMTLIAVDVKRYPQEIDRCLLFMIRFDAGGRYLGMAVLDDRFFRSGDLDRWADTFQKADYVWAGGMLVIESPALSTWRSINVSSLSFHTDFKNDFVVSIYENTLKQRVAFNVAMTTLWVLFAIAMIGFRIRDEILQERFNVYDDRNDALPTRQGEEQ